MIWPDYDMPLEESCAWLPKTECVFVGSKTLISFAKRTELDRLGISYARPDDRKEMWEIN